MTNKQVDEKIKECEHKHFSPVCNSCDIDMVQKALAERDREMVEMVENMECPVRKNHPKECHYPIALADIKALLTKERE